jgi:hypothetical protein
MNRPTQPQSSRLRVQAATSAVNAPIECPSCGSIFFIEAQAGMYTTSGAGFRNVNQAPQKVFLCPCGEIMIPSNYASGVPAGSERDLFVQSLKLAIARRSSTTLDQVAQGTVSLTEHNRLKTQFEELAARFNTWAAGGEVPEPVEIDAPGEVETLEEEEATDPASRITMRELGAAPPIATGTRGRSAAAAVQSTGDHKEITATPATIYTGGARERMKRQGGQ